MRRWALLVGCLLVASLARGQGGETGGGGGPGTGGAGNLSALVDDTNCAGGELVLRNAADNQFDCLVAGAAPLCLQSGGTGALPTWGSCGSSSGGHTIQDDNADVLNQPLGKLNFTTNISCSPDVPNNRINCSASGTGSGITTVEDIDSLPTYGSLNKLSFDQADGFSITNPVATEAEINLSVGDGAIAASAVDGGFAGEIADGTVTFDDLAANSVAASELDLTVGSPVATEIEGAISLSNISTGSVNISKVSGGANGMCAQYTSGGVLSSAGAACGSSGANDFTQIIAAPAANRMIVSTAPTTSQWTTADMPACETETQVLGYDVSAKKFVCGVDAGGGATTTLDSGEIATATSFDVRYSGGTTKVWYVDKNGDGSYTNSPTFSEMILTGADAVGNLIGNGTWLCVDTNRDGVACNGTDPNLTINAPNNNLGNETIQGTLNVVGALNVAAVTWPHEMQLQGTYIDDTLHATNGQCYSWTGGLSSTAGEQPPHDCTGGDDYPLMFKTQVTRLCGSWQQGTIATGSCTIELYDVDGSGGSGLALGNIKFGTSAAGATLRGPAGSATSATCATINTPVVAGHRLRLRATPCSAFTGGANLFFGVFGYGLN